MLVSPFRLCAVRAESAPPLAQGDAVKVTVAIPPQAFVANELFGPYISVSTLIPQGMSHESYEPTVRQVRALSDSRAYISLGHRRFTFESQFLSGLIAEQRNLTLINSAKNIKLRDDDIHYWLAPAAMRQMIENVEHDLVPVISGDATVLAQRKSDLMGRVDALEQELTTMLVPYRGRSFLVFHPSWGYFASQFGLEQLALEHEGKEPGPRHIESMLMRARAAKVKVVFIEPGMARQSAEAVAAELGGSVEVLDPLAYDWIANLRQVATRLKASFE